MDESVFHRLCVLICNVPHGRRGSGFALYAVRLLYCEEWTTLVRFFGRHWVLSWLMKSEREGVLAKGCRCQPFNLKVTRDVGSVLLSVMEFARFPCLHYRRGLGRNARSRVFFVYPYTKFIEDHARSSGRVSPM